MLEGDFSPDGDTFSNDAIAEAYASGHDPMAREGESNPLRIRMLEELRKAGRDAQKKAAIITKYDKMAREAKREAADS